MTDIEARNKATLDLFRKAWASKDVDSLMALVTEDVVYSASVGPEPGQTYVGRDAVREGFITLLAHDTGLSTAGEEMISGDRGFSGWAYVIQNGDGSETILRGMDILDFRDGRIARKDAYRKMDPSPQTGLE